MSEREKRNALTQAAIVRSALDLVQREGRAAVSMRRLATELGVEPMSLYYHIPGKAALMVLMADESVSQMPPQDMTLPWHERLIELLVAAYRAGVENPVVFEVLASDPEYVKNMPTAAEGGGVESLGLLERVLVLLAEGGVPPSARASAYRALISLLVGFIVVEVDGFLPAAAAGSSLRPPTQPPTVPIDQQAQARNDPAMVLGIQPELEQTDPAEAMRSSARWFLDGLLQTAANTLQAKPA